MPFVSVNGNNNKTVDAEGKKREVTTTTKVLDVS